MLEQLADLAAFSWHLLRLGWLELRALLDTVVAFMVVIVVVVIVELLVVAICVEVARHFSDHGQTWAPEGGRRRSRRGGRR